MEQEKSRLKRLFTNKLFIALLVIILVLGIFVRLNDVSLTSYWNDDISTLPTGLLWFYPHQDYPGLSGQGEPALGNYIIAKGCMLSGEDFSGVTKMNSMFYPGREEFFGKALANSSFQCHLPMYIFGILFFLLVSVFSILILKDRCALFAITFFAFYPILLRYSRFIHVDVIEYAFVVFGLIFLLLFYKQAKGTTKEFVYSILAFIGFGLALATKLPTALFFIFGFFIILEKYKKEVISLLKKILLNLNLGFAKNIKDSAYLNYKPFIKTVVAAIVSFSVIVFIGMEYSFKNLFLVFNKYRELRGDFGGFGLNKQFFTAVGQFLSGINIIDILLILAGLYAAYKLVRNKKTLEHKFILYLAALFLIIIIFSSASNLDRVFFIFVLPFIFFAALAMSKKGWLLSVVKGKWKTIAFLIVIIIYVAYSFTLAYNASPFFVDKDKVVCFLTKDECKPNLFGYAEGQIADYLSSHLAEDETFVSLGWSMIYYYTHSDESLPKYYFREQFKAQAGRDPTYEDYAAYFQPFNRTVRYVIIGNNPTDDLFASKQLFDKYVPNDAIYVKERKVAFVYDVKNLNERV